MSAAREHLLRLIEAVVSGALPYRQVGARFFREHRLQSDVAGTAGCGYHSGLAMPRRGAICEQEDMCAHLPVMAHNV